MPVRRRSLPPRLRGAPDLPPPSCPARPRSPATPRPPCRALGYQRVAMRMQEYLDGADVAKVKKQAVGGRVLPG